MRYLLSLICLLINFGIWGSEQSQEDHGPYQAMLVDSYRGSGLDQKRIPAYQDLVKNEMPLNHNNLLVGLKMLKTHNIVLNEYHTEKLQKAMRTTVVTTRREQATNDSKYAIREANNHSHEKYDELVVGDGAVYSCDENKWSEVTIDDYDDYNVLSNKILIFNILPSLNDPSEAGKEIVYACNIIKEMSGYGARIMINTDRRADVEKVLESYFNAGSWVRVPASKITPAQEINNDGTRVKIVLGGGVAAIVAFLCYLKWGR
jgi:hypothetical protein